MSCICFTKKQESAEESGRKKDKRLCFSLLFLAGLSAVGIAASAVFGMPETQNCRIRISFTDCAVLGILAVIFLICRIRKGRNHGR